MNKENNLTTLAIVGGGIAGKSLIYALAKKKNSFSKIIIFESDEFAPSCSLRSTAIVAPRGVTAGHSPLGDLIVKAFASFHDHIENDQPSGVHKIVQYTGAVTKLEAFKQRYPTGEFIKTVGPFDFNESVYMATENAFLIDPPQYLEWLKVQGKGLPLEIRNDFVTQVQESDGQVELLTQNGGKVVVDQVIMAAGNYNRYYKQLSGSKALENSKPIQGSYFEFKNVQWGKDSFSLTFEGDNIVYHAHSSKLLVGSTTKTELHQIPAKKELKRIYSRLQTWISFELPSIDEGQIITGLREKSTQRKPYVLHEGKIHWIGGFYKNGYSLGLHLGMELVSQL